jgi:hypothetical protein
MTIAEEILHAVSILVKDKGMNTFRRLDIRRQIGMDRHKWEYSYSPIFQAMRVDHPGRAPRISEKFKGIFQQVKYGVHSLTEYGKLVINKS